MTMIGNEDTRDSKRKGEDAMIAVGTISGMVGIIIGAVFVVLASEVFRKRNVPFLRDLTTAREQRARMVKARAEYPKEISKRSEKAAQHSIKWVRLIRKIIDKKVADGQGNLSIAIYRGEDEAMYLCGTAPTTKTRPWYVCGQSRIDIFLDEHYGDDTGLVARFICDLVKTEYKKKGYEVEYDMDKDISGFHHLLTISWADGKFMDNLLKVQGDCDVRAYVDHNIPLADIVAGR